MSVACFDIGIRNLAYCCYDKNNKKIIGWDNYDLINDTSVNSSKDKYLCTICSKNALYTYNSNNYCGKHTIKPIFKDLSGNVYKKMPTLSVIKDILKVKKGTKEELYDQVKKTYSVFILKNKVTKKAFDLEALHDSIRLFVSKNIEILRNCTTIGLENQPLLKNPTMKTVQILLYATIRDMLQPTVPKMRLIHALKKVSDKESGDKGYSDRKKASIERVHAFFKENSAQTDKKEFFDISVKKADLADSFCMCLDI